MLEKVTLMQEMDTSYSYILSGDEESTILTVLISGMLYDAKNPPESSVLTKIKRRIASKALSLEVEQMDNRFFETDRKRELPVYIQSKRIEDSIADVIEKYPKIKNINYVTHSMGSVVLYNLLKNQSEFYKTINSSCFLLAPVPFGSRIDDLAKNTTESLLTEDDQNSTNTKSLFIERDNSKVEIDKNVWQCLEEISEGYGSSLSPFSEFDKKGTLNIFIAGNDKVFQNDISSIKKRFANTKITTLSATHSFKDSVASNVITESVLSAINDLE